jgi:hypothetical protein
MPVNGRFSDHTVTGDTMTEAPAALAVTVSIMKIA